MRFVGMDIVGNYYDLHPVSECRWRRHALKCGESLYISLPHVYTQRELESIRVFDDNNVQIFSGNVDRQSAEYSPDGIITKIWARSLAAAMEDNEAVPTSYANQTVASVFSRHAAPYGMSGYDGTNGQLPGEFRVMVGDSEWTAIVKFCRALNGWYPRVNGQRIHFGPFPTLPALHFSNTSQNPNKIPFARAAIRSNRQRYISTVLTRQLASEEFNYPIYNPYGAERFIRRRRVMRYRDSSQSQKLALATHYMDKSRAGSSGIVLLLDGRRDFPLRSPASFEDSILGSHTGWGIASVTYFLDSFCERTEVELWPLEDLL